MFNTQLMPPETKSQEQLSMRVILSSNIPHYVYAAFALQDADYLAKYICAISTENSERGPFKLLPTYWRKKLSGRETGRLRQTNISSLWLPELLQRGLTYTKVLTMEQGNFLCSHLYDWMAQRHVVSCDLFHFSSSVGLYSARKAKARGSIIVCDSRTEHPDYQREILDEEYRKLGLSFEPPGLSYDAKVKAEYEVADYHIVPSQYAKRTFVDYGFAPDRVFVVPYGVDLSLFNTTKPGAAEHNSRNEKFRIIYAGQLIPRKGIHYLIEAFEALQLPDAELLLLGRIDRTMQLFIEAKTRQNSAILALNSVPKVELRRYLQSGSVFVLPSLADSWGLVCAEAMACGLPVIVTENTGSRELVRDGVDGFVIPIRDVQALQDKLRLLYQNPVLRTKMSAAASKRIRAFTWQHYQTCLLDVYEEIMRRERRRSASCLEC